MNVSAGIALKILGGIFATSSVTLGTWLLFIKDGITAWDKGLIDKIMSINEGNTITQAANGGTNPQTTTISINASANDSSKLKIKINKDSASNPNTFEFSITKGESQEEIYAHMLTWECIIEGNNLGDKINSMKESFGIKTEITKITKRHKESLVKFIGSCAYYGTPWRPDSLDGEKKLKRNVKISDGEELNKLFISFDLT